MARANGGTFLLRIEDTDRNRLVETSVQAIYDSLDWLGLDWDEGPGAGGPHEPYFQSQRLPLYQKTALGLIEKGAAYRCFCTPERLDQLRAAQTAAKKPLGYDGLCRDIPAGESERRAKSERFVVRFKMRREGQTVLDDLVRGRVVFENKLQDDFVMLKSDGYPTYHLAVVVDDTEMEITHAIRGDEWISSAPKHIQLYEALGWEPPEWVHLPLILGTDHKKLSKRSGDISTLDYRDKGYLPEAMVNFLAFLGWSLDDKTSLITLDDLATHFSLRVVPNPAVFDIERLNYLNGHYVREMPESAGGRRSPRGATGAAGAHLAPGRRRDRRRSGAAAARARRVLSEIALMVEFLFGYEAPEYSPEALTEKVGATAPGAPGHRHGPAQPGPGGRGDMGDNRHEGAIRAMEEPLGIKLRKFVPVPLSHRGPLPGHPALRLDRVAWARAVVAAAADGPGAG
jgi:glutamyl-tRNA synthetase